MNLTESDISGWQSDDIIRIKENVRGYFLARTNQYLKNLTLYQYKDKIEKSLYFAIRYGLDTENSLIKYLILVLKYSSEFESPIKIKHMPDKQQKLADYKFNAINIQYNYKLNK